MSAPWSAALQRFLDTKDISNAIATCEDLELKGDASPELISLLITLYLIDGATENAVFLWKRTPLAVRQASQGTIDALHTLTTAIVQHPLAVPTLATLSFPDYLRGIADILQDVMRQKSLALLLKSYSVIQLNDIATALCISREQALEGIDHPCEVTVTERLLHFFVKIDTSSQRSTTTRLQLHARR
eukprot:m.124913 g.124913  ORF g.124913 m.124913 type:complete len:187 (-) comp17307_c0_seq2:411-971(-)